MTMGLFFSANRAVIIVNSLLMNAGVERRTLDLAKFILSKGLSVEVFALRELGKIAPVFRGAGIPVRHIRVYDYTEDGRYRFYPLGFLKLVWRLFVGRFGLIFGVQPPSHLFVRAACFPPFGRHIIAMERYLIRGRSRRRLWLDRVMARWSKVVCVSKLLRDELAADAGIPAWEIAVVENGVAIQAPVNREEELRARIAGRFVFGYVGLLTERKRPKLLIEAFTDLLISLPDRAGAVLLFVGDGEDARMLKELVEHLKIQDNAIFAGEQAHPHDFYLLFDVFVFPSVGEGFGNVWAEAMHHGLPVICTDVRPMNDYIRHGDNGLLVAPDDRKSLCDEMRRLMESSGLRREIGERAKKCALEHFESSRQLQKLLDVAIRGR